VVFAFYKEGARLMYCYKCGVQISEDSRFCRKCGVSQPEISDPASSVPPQEASESNSKYDDRLDENDDINSDAQKTEYEHFDLEREDKQSNHEGDELAESEESKTVKKVKLSIKAVLLFVLLPSAIIQLILYGGVCSSYMFGAIIGTTAVIALFSLLGVWIFRKIAKKLADNAVKGLGIIFGYLFYYGLRLLEAVIFCV